MLMPIGLEEADSAEETVRCDSQAEGTPDGQPWPPAMIETSWSLLTSDSAHVCDRSLRIYVLMGPDSITVDGIRSFVNRGVKIMYSARKVSICQSQDKDKDIVCTYSTPGITLPA